MASQGQPQCRGPRLLACTGQRSADEHGDITSLSLRLLFSDREAELSVSGCSQLAGEQIRPTSVLHNGAEFGHVVRPTGVESMQQKKVCTMSSGNTVFTALPDGAAGALTCGSNHC